jgi:hypothetical protein
VEITPEDFRRHFELLSDAALLATIRNDLVDIAKKCLDDEISRRGLDAANAPNPGELSDGERLVRIAKFHSRSEFESARALLRSAFIPSKQGNRIGRRIELELPLMVPAAFAEEALQLLQSRVLDEELAALAEASISEIEATENGQKEDSGNPDAPDRS